MKTTVNYGLKKPDGTDVVNIDDFNYNSDIIDQKLKEVDIKASNITVPVTSVNGKTGAVILSAGDIKAADGKTLEAYKTEVTSELAQMMKFSDVPEKTHTTILSWALSQKSSTTTFSSQDSTLRGATDAPSTNAIQYHLLIGTNTVRTVIAYEYIPNNPANMWFRNIGDGVWRTTWRRMLTETDFNSIVGYTDYGATQIDATTVVKAGMYRNSNWTNRPIENTDAQGTLFVIPYNNGWTNQIFFSPHNGKMYQRHCGNGVWTSWKMILNKDDYDQLFQYANEGKQLATAPYIGGAINTSSTWAQIKTELTNSKQQMVNNLTAKGQTTTMTDSLWTLSGKIGQINTNDKLEPGDTILQTLYKSSNYGDWENTPKCKINVNGTVRIDFVISRYWGRLYKNGVIIREGEGFYGSPYRETFDLSVAPGDLIYGSVKAGSGNQAIVEVQLKASNPDLPPRTQLV